MSVLYLDTEHRLPAYDDIRVGGTGLARVSLNRRVVAPSPAPATPPATSPAPLPLVR
ncbi:hypothetical protein [Micromonospora sp. WMMA1996]|uniref:hypothetical protein n=1 Tax=Micromonospora sp. WMMA1996 TaxID=2039878 RepID=UPI00159BC9F8|nr:hypothetical protein [Micromonospora sp. WMMA1996]